MNPLDKIMKMAEQRVGPLAEKLDLVLAEQKKTNEILEQILNELKKRKE
ncbi:MAG: hypothetical protein QXT26_02655 [Thermoproteota archaeon]